MAIANRNLKKGTGARTKNVLWPLFCANGSFPTYNLANVSFSGATAGFSVPGASFFTRWVQTLLITVVLGDAATVTFLVTGENQFGEVVKESLAFSALLGLSGQTQNCYRRVTSIVMTASTIALPGADNISVGYTNASPGIPLQAKLKSAGSVQSVKVVGMTPDSAQLPFAVTLSPNWAIDFTGTLVGATSIGSLCNVHVLDADPAL